MRRRTMLWGVGALVLLASALATAPPTSASGWEPQDSGASGLLSGIHCPTVRTCIAVGWNGRVAATKDGGSTWAEEGSRTTDSFNDISRVSLVTCFAVGQDGWLSTRTIERVHDLPNGQTTATADPTWLEDGVWERPRRPRPDVQGERYGVSCPKRGVCLAVGSSGTILMSNYGDNVGTGSELLHGVSCIEPDAVSGPGVSAVGYPLPATRLVCTVVGFDGTILRTEMPPTFESTAPNDWATQDSGTGAFLAGVSCRSDLNCYAVGDEGTILATVDGGESWSAQTSNTAELLWSVSCASVSHCVAVGEGGTVRARSNGGATWNAQSLETSQSSGTSQNLQDVSCPAVTDCWAVGFSDLLHFSFVDQAQSKASCARHEVTAEGVEGDPVGCEDASPTVPCEVAEMIPLEPETVIEDVVGGVALPPPGEGAKIKILMESGISQSLSVRHGSDGSVEVEDCGSEAREVAEDETSPPPSDPQPEDGEDPPQENPPPAAADTEETTEETYANRDAENSARTAPKACDGGWYKFHDQMHKWRTTLQSRLNRETIPGYIGETATETAMKDGTKNIVNGRNTCGKADKINATQSYEGGTAKRVDQGNSGTICPSALNKHGESNLDGVNVVDFGDIAGAAGEIAVAAVCVWERVT